MKFNLSWVDKVDMRITIEAKDEEEAEEKFFNGDIDWDSAKQDNATFLEDSLVIDEV